MVRRAPSTSSSSDVARTDTAGKRFLHSSLLVSRTHRDPLNGKCHFAPAMSQDKAAFFLFPASGKRQPYARRAVPSGDPEGTAIFQGPSESGTAGDPPAARIGPPQAVHGGGGADGARIPGGLLRGHVAGRPGNAGGLRQRLWATQAPGQAEVEDLRDPPPRSTARWPACGRGGRCPVGGRSGLPGPGLPRCGRPSGSVRTPCTGSATKAAFLCTSYGRETPRRPKTDHQWGTRRPAE
jgi:hypothetical protein